MTGKKGTPSPNSGKGLAVEFLRANVRYREARCLTWPYSRNEIGYGQFGYRGRQYKAHRFMCELAHGPAPSPRHQAAHSCGNGHLGCVNPNHLSWKTAGDNQAERTVHGTARKAGRPFSLLSEDQVAEIRSLKGKMTNTALAARFGVHRETIGNIVRGISWRGGIVDNNRRFAPHLRERMVQRAKRLRDEGVPLETIGSLLGVSRSTARNFVSE